jgi:hypothetical protein
VVTTKQIVEKLIAPVPPPRHVPPTPQNSWATLKEGDVLAGPDSNRGLGEQGAGLWVVCNVSSAGVSLAPYQAFDGETIKFSDRNWKESGWRKVPKRELKERAHSGAS